MNDHVAVYMLDVGQGDSTIVLLPDARVVIFDCADDHVLRKTLASWNTHTIAAFVLSHLDQDHIAGALQFLQGWPGTIEAVYLSPDRDISDDHEDAKRAKALIDHVVEHSGHGVFKYLWELRPNTRDTRPLASGDDWSVTLLAPPYGQQLRRAREGAWEEANRHSSILRVQAGGRIMLVGADAPLLSWSNLAAKEELNADVFRIPHHGGALDDGGIPQDWSVERLYNEVNAQTALVSVGTNNAYGHPREDWIEPVTGGACRLLCTQVTARCHADLDTLDSDGTVARNLVEIEAQRRRVITKQNQWMEPQYRHLTDRRQQIQKGLLEVPCAGTVIVKLHLDGRPVEVLPAPGGGHAQIVDDWQRPLCRP